MGDAADAGQQVCLLKNGVGAEVIAVKVAKAVPVGDEKQVAVGVLPGIEVVSARKNVVLLLLATDGIQRCKVVGQPAGCARAPVQTQPVGAEKQQTAICRPTGVQLGIAVVGELRNLLTAKLVLVQVCLPVYQTYHYYAVAVGRPAGVAKGRYAGQGRFANRFPRLSVFDN